MKNTKKKTTFFTVRIIKHWNKLAGEDVGGPHAWRQWKFDAVQCEQPALDYPTLSRGDCGKYDLQRPFLWAGVTVDNMISRGPFYLQQWYDSVKILTRLMHNENCYLYTTISFVGGVDRSYRIILKRAIKSALSNQRGRKVNYAHESYTQYFSLWYWSIG